MGIYINGIGMPTAEQGVRTINIYADGVVTNYAEVTIGKAVPVPPHGRLIDADAALKLLRNLGSRDYRREKGTIMDAMKMLSFDEYTPTIIPADGKDIKVPTREENE